MGKRNYLPVPISISRQLYSWWNTCNANSAFFFPDVLQKKNTLLDFFLNLFNIYHYWLIFYWDKCQSKTDTAPDWSQELFTVKSNWVFIMHYLTYLTVTQIEEVYSSDWLVLILAPRTLFFFAYWFMEYICTQVSMFFHVWVTSKYLCKLSQI